MRDNKRRKEEGVEDDGREVQRRVREREEG